MRLTDEIKEYVGTAGWRSFKLELAGLILQAQDSIVAVLQSNSDIQDVRFKAGFHAGLARVYAEMKLLEKLDNRSK